MPSVPSAAVMPVDRTRRLDAAVRCRTTSVVTIVRDRLEHLQAQVRGLVDGRRKPAELVVVVMGGRDPRAVVGRTPFPIRFIDLPHAGGPLPLARARNHGARCARGERLVFLDVDCVPAPDLIVHYEAALDRHPWLLMGAVRYLDRPVRHLGIDRCSLDGASRPHPSRRAPAGPGPIRTTDLGSFWSLSFAVDRTTLVERIGGFDERLVGYGGEDTDLSYAAAQAGVPLAWIPHAVAYHQPHPSFDPPLPHLEAIVTNARLLHAKWGRWVMRGWLDAFARAGLVDFDPVAGRLEVRRHPRPAELARARRPVSASW